MNYDWPLNVRELQKALEVASALALARDGVVRTSDLPDAVNVPSAAPKTDSTRRAELIDLLQRHHGNVSAVAKEFGKARMQVQRWMKQFKLDPAVFRATR
jgi:transcriptional regulator of acetoin/glycerol metabolism